MKKILTAVVMIALAGAAILPIACDDKNKSGGGGTAPPPPPPAGPPGKKSGQPVAPQSAQ